MTFEPVAGLKGKVFVPEKRPERFKKHNCKDCYSCQMCSDLRCEKCLDRKPLNGKPLLEGAH